MARGAGAEPFPPSPHHWEEGGQKKGEAVVASPEVMPDAMMLGASRAGFQRLEALGEFGLERLLCLDLSRGRQACRHFRVGLWLAVEIQAEGADSGQVQVGADRRRQDVLAGRGRTEGPIQVNGDDELTVLGAVIDADNPRIRRRSAVHDDGVLAFVVLWVAHDTHS
jgi:hypothetical protein